MELPSERLPLIQRDVVPIVGPYGEKRHFLRESAEADGGEEVDGESRVPRVVAREQAFEERLQGSADEVVMFIHCLRALRRALIMQEAIWGNLRVFKSFIEPREPHVGTQLLEEDLDEYTAGGRRRLFAHLHALQDLRITA